MWYCEKEKPPLLFYERCTETQNICICKCNNSSFMSLIYTCICTVYKKKCYCSTALECTQSTLLSFIQVCGVPQTHRRTVYRWVCLCDSNNCRVLRGPTFIQLSSNLPTAVRCFFFFFLVGAQQCFFFTAWTETRVSRCYLVPHLSSHRNSKLIRDDTWCSNSWCTCDWSPVGSQQSYEFIKGKVVRCKHRPLLN